MSLAMFSRDNVNFVRLFVLLILLLVVSCAQRPVTDYNPARDFHALHSYAWSEKITSTDQESIVKNALTDQRVHQSVDERAGLLRRF